AGYPFNVMGFALIKELQLLQQAGLTPVEALRSATVEPAAAMRQAGEFGAIRKGMRADLVLLNANPLLDPSVYRNNAGVLAHGIWMERTRMDAALDQLSIIDAEPDTDAKYDASQIAAVLQKAKSLVADGFVFDPEELQDAASVAREMNATETAIGFESLIVKPASGPCALPTPLE